MDYNMGDSDNADNPARLAVTLDSSTQEATMDRLTGLAMQDAIRLAVSGWDAKKRKFDLAFPLARSRRPKWRRSLSPERRVPGDYDDEDNSSFSIDGAVNNNVLNYEPPETLQINSASSLDPPSPQRHSAVEIEASKSDGVCSFDDIKHLLEHSHNEIRKYINVVKQNTPNSQVDRETATILVDGIADLMAAENLATPQEIFQMRCNIAKFQCEATYSADTDLGQENSQTVPSLKSSVSSLTPVPSDISTFPRSPRRSEAVTPPNKLENRSTQTETATTNDTEDDVFVYSDARCDGLTDNELWERELEYIRRLQPLVKGSYTTVNVPLREVNPQFTPVSRANTSFTRKGSGNTDNPISELKSMLEHTLQSDAVASGDRGYNEHDTIILGDTSDDEGMPARTSYIVGGGEITSGMNEVQYAASGEDEEAKFYGLHSGNELQLDDSNDAADSFPNYGDDGMGQGIMEEEMDYYTNQPMSSIIRHDQNAFDTGRHYTDQGSDGSLYVIETSGESSGSENLDLIGTTTHGCAMGTYRGRSVYRERSRSPEYQRGRHVQKTKYREERHFPHEYTRVQSPTRDHREKQHKPGPGYVKGISTMARRVSHDDKKTERYMRDEPEAPQFYGYGAKWSPKEVETTLRYQDRFNDVGEVPGPKSSLRLDLDGYIKDTRINNDALGLEQDIESVHKETFYAGETLDEEQALRSSWTDKSTTLYKGFPLVENIGFVTIANNAKPEGDCYWRALAYILYGQRTRWDLIKADHQAYLRHVLSDKTHPRHELYAKLNTQFFETHGPTLRDIPFNHSFNVTSVFKANLWQLLHMPHSWTPGVMQQVTADLYNIHLVTFEYRKNDNLCSNVSIRGAYNSRHVFMLYLDGCHFQPLAVNEYLG